MLVAYQFLLSYRLVFHLETCQSTENKSKALLVPCVHNILDIFDRELLKKYSRQLNLVSFIIIYGLSYFIKYLIRVSDLNSFLLTQKLKTLVVYQNNAKPSVFPVMLSEFITENSNFRTSNDILNLLFQIQRKEKRMQINLV